MRLNVDTLLPYFERFVNRATEALIVAGTGESTFTYFEKIAQTSQVTPANRITIEKQMNKLLHYLSQSMLREKPGFDQELVDIQTTMRFGKVHPVQQTTDPTLREALSFATSRVYRFAQEQFATYLPFLTKTQPPARPVPLTEAQKVANVNAAFQRMKTYIRALPESGKLILRGEARLTGETKLMRTVFSLEIKAQIFNLATLAIISNVALAALGLIGFKFMLLTVATNYVLRMVADRSLAATNVSTIAIPTLHPMIKLRIPSLTGVLETTHRSLQYCALYLGNKHEKRPFTQITTKDLFSREGWGKIVGNVWRLKSEPGDWSPNFLTVGGVVILKNGATPLPVFLQHLRRNLF